VNILSKIEELKDTPQHTRLPLWSRMNEKVLREIRSSINQQAFDSQFRLSAISDEDKDFPMFEQQTIKEYEFKALSRTNYLHFCGIDLSGNKRKGNVMVTIALDLETEKKIICDLIIESAHNIFTQKIASTFETYRPEICYIEQNATQALFIERLENLSDCRWIPFIRGYTTTQASKISLSVGIPNLALDIQQGNWIIPNHLSNMPNFKILINQFSNYPHTTYNDTVMATFFANRAVQDQIGVDLFLVEEPNKFGSFAL